MLNKGKDVEEKEKSLCKHVHKEKHDKLDNFGKRVRSN